ncbi:uncharacterized protein [Macrobrachium rosenbergii]|uniref:uncharacterized protein n=1 Tax=Macrobrachium rosenbergii TaxID=79674 RepID=UPI0034D60703
MSTEEHQYFRDIGKEDGLIGQALQKFVREQTAEKRKYEEEQRQEEEEREEQRRQQEAEQRREEEEQEERKRQCESEEEERRRQHELALKDRELELERAKKESAEALAAQQVSSPTPSALNTSLLTVNNLVGKWTEDELEQWLEEIEFLFETYDVSLAERALLLTKHMDGKAKAAHRALERDQRGDMAAIREAIVKAATTLGNLPITVPLPLRILPHLPGTLSLPGDHPIPGGPAETVELQDTLPPGILHAQNMVAPRHVNLISATASLAEPPERTHPERVWTKSVSVASQDGSSPPVHLPTTANTGSDITLIDRAQVPASAKVDEPTKWTVTWVDEQSLTIPTIELRVITPWSNKIHRLGIIKRIWPSPQISRPDSHQKTTPSSSRNLANYRCRTCSIRGHSEKWSKCPSKLATAAISKEPRGLALPSKQESLSQLRPGIPRGLAPPGPPSALSDTHSLPVPLASTGQCQAPPISAGSSMPILLPVPGPELVPVPDPEPDPDPSTGDPPNLTTMIIAQCEPLTPDVSSSHTLLPAEDDPLAGLDITSFLVDQELSGQEADADSLPTTVVAAAEVGDQPVAPEAAPDPAPDITPGRSSESVPSSPPRNGLARPWMPPNKKKKGGKKST